MIDDELDKVKIVPIETCTDEERTTIAESLAKLVNEFVPARSYPDDRVLILKKDGYIPINVINRQQVEEIVTYLQTKTVYNAHVPYGDGNKRNLSEARHYPFGCYDLCDIIACPHFLKIALSDEVLNLAHNYLGCTPTLYSMNSWWSFPGHGAVTTQKYHRDYDDYKFLALFIYLTDVTTMNGAHCYIKESHNSSLSAEAAPEVFVGTAGTTFLSDTYGIHKSLPLVAGDRLVAWFRYGLARNGPSSVQIRERVSKVGIDIKFDERLNYITRLILN